MKIEIIPSNSNIPVREGWVRLTEKDFNHYESFFAKHPDILPESVEEIYTRGVLEVSNSPVVIMRHIDWLLKLGGHLSLDIFRYMPWSGPFNEYKWILSLLSMSFRGHFIAIKKENVENFTHVVYEKQITALPDNDSIDCWSFAICSNGTQNSRVIELINQIISLKIPYYEIIVCGPKPAEYLQSCVRVIDDTSIYVKDEVRVPISKKKNLIAQCAKYNNLVIMHDRIIIPPEWYECAKKYGNYFDIIGCSVRDVDDISRRVSDWGLCDGWGRKSNISFLEKPPYDFYSADIFINGGFFIVKKNILETVPMNEFCHWDEVEDIEYCHRLSRLGYLVGMDINNKVLSYTYRLGSSMLLPNRVDILRNKRSFYSNYIIETKFYQKYSGVSIPKSSLLIFWIKYVYYRFACYFMKRVCK